ncbi:hypothetical protein BT93_E0698 [Corymbia citriodora subsp. variegata]|nr:hypothetical protein BT93_E0698 [Corymbia citriodora subsp. variegata]
MRQKNHFVLINDIVTTINLLLLFDQARIRRRKKPPEGSVHLSLCLCLCLCLRVEREMESYVVVHNIAKRHNVGTLARSATAFGVSELIIVGRRDFNAFGSHGSTSHLAFRHFHSLLEARSFLKEKGCDICGVEITDDAVAVNQHPFKRSTAFLVGNEGTGLSAKECEICDFFVYIPQYGCGTASLNVTVAASIVLHHFADSGGDDIGWSRDCRNKLVCPFFISATTCNFSFVCCLEQSISGNYKISFEGASCVIIS